MTQIQTAIPRMRLIAVSGIITMAMAGCSGNDGAAGPAGPPGPPGAVTAKTLAMTITGATISSPPVVNFTVKNEDDKGFTGLTTSDLRFTIAKLVPGSNGNPSKWQNYIVTVQNASAPDAPKPIASAVQGTRENNGTLVDKGDGTYTYTFATDVANVSCPAPCQDAYGNTLDLSYNASLTHRIGIQTRGDQPAVNATYTFRPSDGATSGIFGREIVKTAKCNECHDKIEAHDARIETKYCVTCHNPGSTDPDSGHTVDLKVMIHKIHRGEDLPSVAGGGEYAIWGYGNTKHDFSTIVLPQDIRNCTKCHDGADPETPQGANWDTAPSIEACGSCHDNIKFDVAGPPAGTDPDGHPGGIVNNSECLTCHALNKVAGSVAAKHVVPGKAERAFFKFNILEICGTAVGANPACAPASNPAVKFSVTDPTGATTHGYGNAYNINGTSGDPEFTGSGASLNVLVAWDTRDYNNAGGSGTRPARADSVNVRTSTAVMDNGDGTFTLTGALVTPTPLVVPVGTTGSGAIAMEGHPAADFDGDTVFSDRVAVKGEVAFFGITDATPKARRQVVDVTTKCDRCHDLLTLHGSNRTDNGQLCVLCHNPSNTDVGRRPMTDGLPDPSRTVDGKKEESIDFKRLIHGIHAAAKTNFDGTIAHGFREKGLAVYGFGSNAHDYSHVRFPGVLSKCQTCHLPGTYTLQGTWELPAQNGILGSTIDSAPGATAGTFATLLASQTDDLNISPTAAVCSACHDGAVAKSHMQLNGGLFSATEATIATNVEACAVCHGPGKIVDVEQVHSPDFGGVIP